MAIPHRCAWATAPLVALLHVAACQGSTDLDDTVLLQVSVVVSPSEMLIGDTADVIVTAANPTRDTLTFRSNACVTFYDVLDSLGTEIFSRPRLCNDIGLTHHVAPGESLVDTIPFDGLRPVSYSPFQPPDTLPPGLYLIRGRIAGGPWSAPDSVRLSGVSP